MEKLWFVFDSLGNIINEGEGFENKEAALDYFRDYWTKEEAEDLDYSLALLDVQPDGEWTVIEELALDEIFPEEPMTYFQQEAADREKAIAIMMQDGCTRRDAERHLAAGTVVLDSVDEWYNFLGDFAQDLEAEFETDEWGLKAMVLSGNFIDTCPVEYKGHQYIVEYAV